MIDTPVRVSSSTNMSPYMTTALDGNGTLAQRQCMIRALCSSKPRGPDLPWTLHKLCALPGYWSRCFDDDKVTPATLADVLGKTAPIYMAFYVKRRLDYEPYHYYAVVSCLCR
ncbi:hypothetical protein H4582DRAFT_1322150 [Lactarius indigo]|nr:hypothetical protein H4582DRAFT_1322150 [Lactarius indigo]